MIERQTIRNIKGKTNMTFKDDCTQWYELTGDEVMGYSYGALGDSFAMFSHTVNMGKKFNKAMKLSVRGDGKKQRNFRKFYELVKDKQFVDLVDEPATTFNKLFCTRKHFDPYCELIYKWEYNTQGINCYHYDKMTADKRGERFPDKEEEQYFLRKMDELGAINISYPMPLEEVVKVASKCERFIGIESGISHIIHAVGTPCTIRNWGGRWSGRDKKVADHHPNKQYTLVDTFYEI